MTTEERCAYVYPETSSPPWRGRVCGEKRFIELEDHEDRARYGSTIQHSRLGHEFVPPTAPEVKL